MSCEEAKAREERAKKRLLEAERELLATNTPLLGRVNFVNEAEKQAIADVHNDYADAYREWLDAASAWLAAKEQHHD